MKLPFTVEDFLAVFENYNKAVYPMHIVLYLLAATVVFLSVKGKFWSDKTISGILSFFWLWMGIVYHFIFFTVINKAAYLFGGLFVLQGALFFWKGVYQNKLNYQLTKNLYGLMGLVLFVFSLIVYPVISYSLGHVYPAGPTFGLPCPTTIFTFGIFLLFNRKYPKVILIIPFIWALIGFSASLSLGINEDIGLLGAAVVSTSYLITKQRNLIRTSE